MKIYTRTGDQGQSSLFSGERIAKNHLRLQVYGELDHVNVILAQIVILLNSEAQDLLSNLGFIQERIFTASSELATVDSGKLPQNLRCLQACDVARLEQLIDELSEGLPVLKNFVLPGGNQLNICANQARVLTRKAESLLVALMQESESELNEHILQFLNRLSDYFFVLGRWFVCQEGQMEVLWKP